MGAILVVEDDDKLRALVRSYLEAAGLSVLTAGTGAEAISIGQAGDLDLVVLDLGLPDIPGQEVARTLRATTAVPILVLTARSSDEDRVAGLELGVDDYVTKPFVPRELVLRVQAILRRTAATAGEEVQRFGDGGLCIDAARREVTVGGEVVHLTPTEWALLQALASHPGRVYSRAELINRTRGYEYEGYERTVDSHVKNLRRKLQQDPLAAPVIETVVGGGYRLGVRRDR